MIQVGQVGGNRQNANGVSVAQAALPALYSDNGGARLDDVELQRIPQSEADAVVDLARDTSILASARMPKMMSAHICLPLVALNATGLRVPEGVAAAVQVDLAGGLLVARHCKRKLARRTAHFQ